MSRRLTWSIPALLAAVACACALSGAASAGAAATPTITGFAPNHGLLGERVTIYGHDLAGAQVWFNGVPVDNVTVDATGTHLRVNVPGETTTGPGAITVTTPGGSVTTTTMFTVNPPNKATALPRPRLVSIAPMRGSAGTKVTIWGHNLGGALWVKFGGVRATYTVPSSTKIVAIVPKRAHSGKISVKTSGGLATASMRFAVLGSAGT
jgi:IPT/TIG domain